ncbi:MAG: 50S ribosomal protein L13 [Planctomycetota bacterium]|nr:MAG: 50S ribosomal protein L13 [Planctomycetota bacterium]
MTGTSWAKADAPFDWFVVDASEHRLGRLAVAIAETLMGKRKPIYTPHVFTGDGVIVLNAGKVQTTGMKHERRVYTQWSGYVGGLKKTTLGEMREKDPRKLLTLAVRRMLPKNRMGKLMLSRLKIYEGAEHPHMAQQPKDLVVELPRWTPGS